MMPARKFKLLALHGKGTSARIMKAQIKPIVDMLGDILEVHYMDGGEASAPYQGIEKMFPKESYYAWYERPTSVALRAAHNRVANRLSAPMDCDAKRRQRGTFAITTSFERDGLGELTPPETPTSATSAFATAVLPLCRSYPFESHRSNSFGTMVAEDRGGAHWRYAHVMTGVDTPESCPTTAGPRTPMDMEHGSYDGLICFSQGCAVSTGFLLELETQFGHEGRLPVRFVILICGGRPFDWNGTMERVDTRSVAPIALPSIHIHGGQDPGVEESRRLASLYSDEGKQVIELNIGHCPPRRTSDVNVVVAAIQHAISELA